MSNKNLIKYINQECKKIQFKNMKAEEKFKNKLVKTFIEYLDIYHARALVKDNPEAKEFKKQNRRFNKIRFKLYDLVGKLIDKPREPKTAMDYYLEESGETLVHTHEFLEKGNVPNPQSPYAMLRIKINEMWDAYIKDTKQQKTGNESVVPQYKIDEHLARKTAKRNARNNGKKRGGYQERTE